MSKILDELEAAAEKAFADGKAELVLKREELEALVAAYADAPKPRWYAVAGFLGGVLVGVLATLACMAAR